MNTSESADKLGIEFTEKMTGFLANGTGTDFPQLETQKPDKSSPFEFVVTICSTDLDKMIQNERHEAVITGTVKAPQLSAKPMEVANGVFNLFIKDPSKPETRNMVYRFQMRRPDGKIFFLQGEKIILDQSVLQVWHDTTTLHFTVYDGESEVAPLMGKGILRIQPGDFLKQLTTMRVTNATTERETLAGLVRFGAFFAGTLWQHYGGVFAGPYAFDANATPRQKRPLNAPPPEFHPFETEDRVQLLLTRYRGGNKGPVIVVHGLGVSSLIFSTDTIQTNLLEYLVQSGYDVWLLDFRASTALSVSQQLYDGDKVAQYDYPDAVAKVREVTGAATVQFVVHCWGATTFFLSMLRGLQGVRSFVSSQIGAFFYSPVDVELKVGLHVPQIFDKLGIKGLSADATTNEPWWKKLYDEALALPAMVFAQGQCHSAVCHRITFMYASLYNHEKLNDAAHDNLHELFGIANMRAFEHIATIGRAGRLVDFFGNNIYLPNLERLNLPIAFVHGEENHCFLPKGTEETYNLLCKEFGPSQYSRHVIKGYGHIDCIFGKDAALDVYPYIIQHLDKTN